MDRLWVERYRLETLEFKLVAAKLFLASDVRRFVVPALSEVERAVEQVRAAELGRSLAVARIAEDWRVPAERVTLGYLVDHAPEPAAEIFEEHGEAFLALTTAIEVLALENRLMAQDALDHLRETIDDLVGADVPAVCGASGLRADDPPRPRSLGGIA